MDPKAILHRIWDFLCKYFIYILVLILVYILIFKIPWWNTYWGYRKPNMFGPKGPGFDKFDKMPPRRPRKP